ncbi:MAG: beta-phosphoglucomutase family hydrolase [Candidatus Omnitrophica bacterium]|nr:beta-phosphoglucomutase family hydrolase [Candidatus Omnitrophota bacterium]
MPFQGAIFDLDGVIVNTVPLHFKAWKKMFGEYGREFTFEDYKNKVDGIPRTNGARAVLTDLSDAELERADAKKQDYFLQFLAQEGIEVYQSSLDLVKELRKKKIKTAVISSSKNCLPILKKAKIDYLFEVIITGADVKIGKPAPDIFLLASKKLALSPQDCIVFEDALLGVEAAKRGHFICIGVDRYQHPQRLAKADLVISDLAQVNLNQLRKMLPIK